jgi:hypothetical protein
MNLRWSAANLIRGTAYVSVLGLIAVLLWLLPQPGYSQSRLVLFGLITAAAALGTTGTYLHHPKVTVAGVIGLFLLGFWQAVLSVFIWPVIGLLILTAIIDYENSSNQSET